MSHLSPTVVCAATRCGLAVQRGMLMCRDHWFSLPKPLRDDVWRTWRSAFRAQWHGDARDAEDRLARIRAYRDAVRNAVDYLDSLKAEARS